MQETEKAGPRPGEIGRALTALEQALARNDDPLPHLGRLADPARLDFLFQLELCKILRAGPAEQISPGRLLSLAQHASAAGALPLATPSASRRLLERLAREVRASGAWDPASPMWWSPLPPPSSEEELWNGCREIEAALPSRDPVTAALSDPSAPRWLSLPALVPAPLTRALHRELEAAHRAGNLALERAGVGAGARLSSRRADSVLYLSGLEPGLLHAAPCMAALVQWCLAHLGGRLAALSSPCHVDAPPARRLFPPQKAMLARYPAPSGGYHPHLDNPGGSQDNGRALTLVIYLNAPGNECAGGEINLWAAGAATTEPPAAVLPAQSGSVVLFDARAIAHQVRPLAAGPARWALTLWFNDVPQAPPSLPPPKLTVNDLLLPISDPPLPPETVLFHELDDTSPAGQIIVRDARPSKSRVGIVSTVYRAGAALDAWCDHHFALGVDHLVLVFDHLEEPTEAADAARLTSSYSADRLTVWPGSRTAERWAKLLPEGRELERVARSGSSNPAIAARQTLNASVALRAARGDELGGPPLDWLLHLDADELFYLEGDGRGGATLERHFAAATAAGLSLLRYVNHELLRPHRPGSPPCFKRNPRLATAHLGTVGWSRLVSYLEMAQTAPRPYFTGYFNGKSAVAVAHGAAAAGVHGWSLRDPSLDASRFLAGPSVLHFHLASPAAFRHKYLAVADSPVPPGTALFQPSLLEVAVLEEIRSRRRSGADNDTLAHGLDEFHARMTAFSDHDVEILEEAGLILRPNLDHALAEPLTRH